jgi:hypothetical protein
MQSHGQAFFFGKRVAATVVSARLPMQPFRSLGINATAHPLRCQRDPATVQRKNRHLTGGFANDVIDRTRIGDGM